MNVKTSSSPYGNCSNCDLKVRVSLNLQLQSVKSLKILFSALFFFNTNSNFALRLLSANERQGISFNKRINIFAFNGYLCIWTPVFCLPLVRIITQYLFSSWKFLKMRSAQGHKDSKLFRSLNKVTKADLFSEYLRQVLELWNVQIHMLANTQQHCMLYFLQKCYLTHDSVLIYL